MPFIELFQLYFIPILCLCLGSSMLSYAGSFVILRREVFFSAVLSQVSAFGIAMSLFLYFTVTAISMLSPIISVILFFSSLLINIIVALILVQFQTERRNPYESAMAFAYVTISALMLMIAKLLPHGMMDVNALLFGSLILISDTDFIMFIFFSALFVLFHGRFYRRLWLMTLDFPYSKMQGVNVKLTNILFIISLTCLIAFTTKLLGGLIVLTSLVIPAFFGIRYLPKFRHSLIVSTILSFIASGIAFYLALTWDTDVGPLFALTLLLLSCLCFLGIGLFKRFRAL